MRRFYFFPGFLTLAAVVGGLTACESFSYEGDSSAPTTYGQKSSTSDPALIHPKSPDFVGLDLFEAMQKAESQNLDWRIIKRDGKTTGVSGKTKPERLNFVIEDSKVISITQG